MNFAVFADVHFGKTHNEKVLLDTVNKMRSMGISIIWLGDTYDILCLSDAVKKYSHNINQSDLFITGNHDWGVVDRREIVLGGIYMTHGDLLDFGYGFGRLQQVREGTVKGTPLERVLSRFRKWSLRDTFTFYDLKYELTDKEVNDFQNGGGMKHILTYAKLFWRLLKSPLNEPYPLSQPLPKPPIGKYLGYLSTDPLTLLERLLILYPSARQCSTIVIGHLHTSIDTHLEYNGTTYRLICINSWIQSEPPQILNILDADGTIQIVDIE